MSICSFVKTRRPLRAVLLMMAVALTFLLSCGGTAPTYAVALEFAAAKADSASDNNGVGFDETACIVLRCASIEQNEQGIVVTTSKSKDMEANTLVFVEPVDDGNSEGNVRIVSTPIVGKEYEYDMTQALFYLITRSSAEAAMGSYGIPYWTWQEGACSSSEKFPCCE